MDEDSAKDDVEDSDDSDKLKKNKRPKRSKTKQLKIDATFNNHQDSIPVGSNFKGYG